MPADFTLEPDLLEAARPASAQQLSLVGAGLAPTADLPPPGRRLPEAAPCYAPCEACGAAVLTGVTATGVRLALETQGPTYTVDWAPGTPQPIFRLSRGYPVHRCLPARQARNQHGGTV